MAFDKKTKDYFSRESAKESRYEKEKKSVPFVDYGPDYLEDIFGSDSPDNQYPATNFSSSELKDAKRSGTYREYTREVTKNKNDTVAKISHRLTAPYPDLRTVEKKDQYFFRSGVNYDSSGRPMYTESLKKSSDWVEDQSGRIYDRAMRNQPIEEEAERLNRLSNILKETAKETRKRIGVFSPTGAARFIRNKFK